MHTVFAPHGMCMMWNSNLIWLHVVTDALVSLSYYSIPAALFVVASKKKDAVPVRPLLVLFGLFIAFCGAGHAMDIISIWKPIYWIKGFWNLGTAITSVVTAIVLIPRAADYISLPETTARLQREKLALQEEHGVLRTVLNSVSEGILVTDQSGKAIAHNPAASQILGKDLEVDCASGAGETERNGLTVEYSIREVEHLGRLYVMRDVTEKRRSEEKRLRLEHAIATMSDGFAIMPLQGGPIEDNNGALDAMYGAPMKGKPGEDLFGDTPESQRANFQAVREAVEATGSWSGEFTCRNAAGTPFPVLARVSGHAGHMGRFLSILSTDISEQKLMRAEAERLQAKLLQSQKMESLGVLAGGVAHDFNNLLTGIMGNASLALQTSQMSAEARDRLNQVITASSRAADLTRQMLAYAGKGRFILRPLDLSALSRETQVLVHHSIPSNVELRTLLGDSLPLVEGDAIQIQQLIMNLIINGAEASNGAAGVVEIRTFAAEIASGAVVTSLGEHLPAGNYVCVEVRDNGSGMSPETMSQIFDPFFTTKFTGRGLGLAASLGIVRSHGGGLKLESELGVGSRFTVFLPALQGQERPVEKPVEAKSLKGSGTVLVVDDEETVSATALHSLRHYGYEAVGASSGAEAVKEFRVLAPRVALVLLDATMPVMSGAETLVELRKIRADVPVILMSGFTEAEAAKRFGNADLAGFIQKPFLPRDLAEMVKAAIVKPA